MNSEIKIAIKDSNCAQLYMEQRPRSNSSLNGVIGMQGMMRQRIPIGYQKPYEYEYKSTSVNKEKLLSFQRRNVFFEPSLAKQKNIIS
jgi:hypothetical protein